MSFKIDDEKLVLFKKGSFSIGFHPIECKYDQGLKKHI